MAEITGNNTVVGSCIGPVVGGLVSTGLAGCPIVGETTGGGFVLTGAVGC